MSILLENPTPPTYTPPPPSAVGTVLLVDDEPVVRAMTGAVLTAMGWNVLNVGSGEEAVHMLEQAKAYGASVDLVILDLILPCGMSGLDAAQTIRAAQPDIRILACSGFFGDDGATTCLQMGFNSILEKPFTAEDLAQAVYQCMHADPRSPELSPAAA